MVLKSILQQRPEELRQHNLNLVSKKWHAIIAASPFWKASCIAAKIPPVSGENVDWHAHFLSASKSAHMRHTAMRQILRNKNIFITGPGGTGKTAMIHTIRTALEKADVEVHVTALTAAAAELIDGTTLHKWAGIGLGDAPGAELVRQMHAQSRVRIRKTRVLIIDEISMCSRDLFDKIDYVCREVRRFPAFFGGIQVILSGDFFQLPPIEKHKTGKFVFQSMRYQEGIDHVFSFSHIYRSADEAFSKLLLRARSGELSGQDLVTLSQRTGNPLQKYREMGIVPTRMHCLRSEVDQFNAAQLAGIPGKPRLFDMEVEAFHVDLGKDESARQHVAKREYKFTFRQARIAAINNCSVAERVMYKNNAQVILAVNLDPENGLVNGSRGVIVNAHHEAGVEVQFACGIRKVIRPYKWVREREFSDNKQPIEVHVKQIPLALGWATTVHRAQGMTLDCVEVDLGVNVFQPGMAYVALSRVKKLDALSFTSFFPKSVYATPIVGTYYKYIEEHGTHAGFLEQLNKIAFPTPFDMQQLAQKLPALTAKRMQEREARERQEADQAVASLSTLPPVDREDVLAKFTAYMEAKREKKRLYDTTLAVTQEGVSVDTTDTDALAEMSKAATTVMNGKEEEEEEEDDEDGDSEPEPKTRRIV